MTKGSRSPLVGAVGSPAATLLTLTVALLAVMSACGSTVCEPGSSEPCYTGRYRRQGRLQTGQAEL